MYSVLYVQSSSYETRTKERAYEELKSYTDLWKAKLAGNDVPQSGSMQNTQNVCLEENSIGNCINEATIHSNINLINTGTSLSKRNGLKTQIVWEARNGSEREINFYLEQLVLSTGDGSDE